jgi:ABC-type transport system substrate-binding protein
MRTAGPPAPSPSGLSRDRPPELSRERCGVGGWGLGTGAQLLLADAAAGTAGETSTKRDLIVLQASDITALNPHASTPHDYWRHPEFDRLAITARLTEDESVRADAYGKMTAIFLEYNPWIVVLQPYESYGLRRYVEYTPSPDQQLELRRFNFHIRRA